MKGVPYRVYVVAPRRKKEGRNWQLLAKPPAGSGAKRLRKTSKTQDKAEAEARAAAWEAILNGLAAPLASCATFGDLAAKHLAHRETDGTPEGTVTTYRTAFKRVAGLLGAVPLAEVDGPAVARARQALLARGLDGKTVNVTLSRCRSAWAWGVELGHVRAPWPAVRGAKARRTKKRPMRATEVRAFFRWLEGYQGGRWVPFFHVAAETGARSGDVCALNGRHVDRAHCRVWIRDRKKKGEERWSGVTKRTIAMLPKVGADEPVFTTQRGRPSTNAALYVFRMGVKALGIEDGERLDVHSLRRMNSKEADRAGVPEQLAAKQQGHGQPRLHMHYGADPDDDEDMNAVAEAIASRWSTGEDHDGPRQEATGRDARVRGAAAACIGGSGRRADSSRTTRPVAAPADRPSRSGTRSGTRSGVHLRDPHAATYGRWAAEDPAAAWALANDAWRIVAWRQAMVDAGIAPKGVKKGARRHAR